MDDEATFTKSVGLGLGALWIAVIALRALTFTEPVADNAKANEILARAGNATLPVARLEPRGAFSHGR
jgi:hypothetical protein